MQVRKTSLKTYKQIVKKLNAVKIPRRSRFGSTDKVAERRQLGEDIKNRQYHLMFIQRNEIKKVN